ncbi:hypothetical protein OPV22_021100 [Ensete ventricosum]|uniref:Neprosin domain-containing protein n=1 Tax=Ensete ventricosum TaxID=4639 RepID=A0AAV8QRG1_ENSVE|nr:hypothetical protein OPV22_021100 [Ensete ventricosum]
MKARMEMVFWRKRWCTRGDASTSSLGTEGNSIMHNGVPEARRRSSRNPATEETRIRASTGQSRGVIERNSNRNILTTRRGMTSSSYHLAKAPSKIDCWDDNGGAHARQSHRWKISPHGDASPKTMFKDMFVNKGEESLGNFHQSPGILATNLRDYPFGGATQSFR